MNDFQSKYDAVQAELEKSKTEANQQYQAMCGQVGYGLGGALAGPAQLGLRDRVAANLCRAQREAQLEGYLYELQRLLEKNPDVARILDLLETAQLLRV